MGVWVGVKFVPELNRNWYLISGVFVSGDTAEGRPEILMSPPVWNLRAVGLIPLFDIYSLLFFCLVLSLFLFDPFTFLAHSPDHFFPKPAFSERYRLSCVGGSWFFLSG